MSVNPCEKHLDKGGGDHEKNLSDCPCSNEEDFKPSERPCSTLEAENGPKYLPLLEDKYPKQPDAFMGPIGPWATGRPVYNPMTGMTGLRPVVDRYSLTRYAPSEWRSHNLSLLTTAYDSISDSQRVAADAKSLVDRTFRDLDKAQLESTQKLQSRFGLINDYKNESEHTIKKITDEMVLLEFDKQRVNVTLSVLTIPQSIAGEFLEIRSTRMEPDLVFDEVENELIKERALCKEINDLFLLTLEQINKQLDELRAVKEQLEINWSDKNDACRIDSKCIKLHMGHPEILWKPGVTRIPANQSSQDGYENYVKDVLNLAEVTKQGSINLRSTLASIYENSLKDLREQATKVDIALEDKIKLTEQFLHQLENELIRVLRDLANTEKLIAELESKMLGLDRAMKVGQTRLDNRLLRPNVENCRDMPQLALLEEVKMIGDYASAMKGKIKMAQDVQAKLIETKCKLEKDIIVKRKSLYVDKDRGKTLRSCYPSTANLTGIN